MKQAAQLNGSATIDTVLISGSTEKYSALIFILFGSFSFTSCWCLSGEQMFFICTWTSESFPQPFQGRSAQVALSHHSPTFFLSSPPLHSEDFTFSVSQCTSNTFVSIPDCIMRVCDWEKRMILIFAPHLHSAPQCLSTAHLTPLCTGKSHSPDWSDAAVTFWEDV